MRRSLRILGYTVGGLFTLLVAYVGLLVYPNVLFAHHVEYGHFRVHSDQDLGPELEELLNDMEEALATSEIYDSTLRHDVYFGYGNAAFDALHPVPVLTYNLSLPPYSSQIITFRIPDFEADALRHPNRREAVNLRHTLTHEVVHTFLMAKLGLRGVARAPLWKQEGYADYVAASTTTFRNDSYTIRASVERILAQDLSWLKDSDGNFTSMPANCSSRGSIRNEEGFVWPACYYVARVLWEYLLNEKGLTFDYVMKPAVTDAGMLHELIATYDAGDI